eukprot:TCONS_00038870-protein
MAAYVRDVWSRDDASKAQITSVFGDILKIDSTKKILKKLAGEARGTATWVTNVSNEYGGVLQSVLTSTESNYGLQEMANGLMRRYDDANIPHPKLLYTDRVAVVMTMKHVFTLFFQNGRRCQCVLTSIIL